MSTDPGSRDYEAFTDRVVAYTTITCGVALFIIAIAIVEGI